MIKMGDTIVVLDAHNRSPVIIVMDVDGRFACVDPDEEFVEEGEWTTYERACAGFVWHNIDMDGPGGDTVFHIVNDAWENK